MSTTSVFIEILIIGVQATLWIILLIIGIVGYDKNSLVMSALVSMFDKAGSLMTIWLLAITYTIGIIIDRLGDSLFVVLDPKKILLKNKRIENWVREAHIDQRVKIFAREKSLTSLLEYIRSRIRILRATSFNVLAFTIATIVFLALQYKGPFSLFWLIFLALLIGLGISWITFVAWGMLEFTYSKRLEQAISEVEALEVKNEQK